MSPAGADGDTTARPAVTAVVLAAGASRRMGADNKLLAEVHGAPMIARVVDAVRAAPVTRVVVVTGHEQARVRAALAGRPVSFVHNPAHAQGMSTSLRAGVDALGEDADAVLVCLGDMPRVEPRSIAALIAAFDPGAGREICVPLHQGRRGNPVLFGARFFEEMRRITGDVGARALIEAHAGAVHAVSVEHGGVLLDVDTAEALAGLRGGPAAEE